MMSFPYFPLYVLDQNNGVVLFNDQYQLGTLGGDVDLYAQVKGATVSTYSWNTSGLAYYYGSLSGTSTYHLHFQWAFTASVPSTQSITLTVTDTNGHQENETIYFELPTANVVSLPNSASWPTTISPDLVEAGAPSIPSEGVSVDADSGALDSTINLPSYNPNVPALALTYNSLTAKSAADHHSPAYPRSDAGCTYDRRFHVDVQLGGRDDLVLQHVDVQSRRRRADGASGQRRQPGLRPIRLFGPGR